MSTSQSRFSQFDIPAARVEFNRLAKKAENAMLNLNLGCGHNKIPDFLNVDKSAACKPDFLFDVETGHWPWKDNTIQRVSFIHSLEHMGQDPVVFQHIIRELYRVCVPDAEVLIVVPHPRHDDFISDPTHVRPITPELFQLLSKKNNDKWLLESVSNSTLALYNNVDFEIVGTDGILDEPFMSLMAQGQLQREQLDQMIKQSNNIVKELHIKLRVVKDAGRGNGNAEGIEA